MGIVIKAQNH